MKLLATIIKDFRILTRDRTGLMLMFAMPIILVIVVTIIQNNTFDLLSKNKITVLVSNQDQGPLSRELLSGVEKMGMFKLVAVDDKLNNEKMRDVLESRDAVMAIVIPARFSEGLSSLAKSISGKALHSFGLESDSVATTATGIGSLTLLYKPEIQPAVKISIEGSLNGALQAVQSRLVLKNLYFAINEKTLPDSLEQELTGNHMAIEEISISKNGDKGLPNASQHNIPAWTIFAMFFVVMSLGGNIVREKSSGSFTRLKTLPTSYTIALFSKQITYLLVTFLQAAIIFGIGLWIFPLLGLPNLNLPADKLGLIVVTLVCGWCAVSYALCIGVLANTQEQANGFGAISIVILAVIGGLMIPSFAMPESFRIISRFSPLHWCLQAYYDLFLEGGELKDVLTNILPLILITILLQLVIFVALKKKNLI